MVQSSSVFTVARYVANYFVKYIAEKLINNDPFVFPLRDDWLHWVCEWMSREMGVYQRKLIDLKPDSFHIMRVMFFCFLHVVLQLTYIFMLWPNKINFCATC